MSTIGSIDDSYNEYRRAFVSFHYSRYPIDDLHRQAKAFNELSRGFGYVVIEGNNIGSKRKRADPSEVTALRWIRVDPTPPTLGASTSDAVIVILEGNRYAEEAPNGVRTFHGDPPTPGSPISIASSEGEAEGEGEAEEEAPAERQAAVGRAARGCLIRWTPEEAAAGVAENNKANAKIVTELVAAAVAKAIANPPAAPEASADMSDEERAVWADGMVVDGAEHPSVKTTTSVSVQWRNGKYAGVMRLLDDPDQDVPVEFKKFRSDGNMRGAPVWHVKYDDDDEHYFCKGPKDGRVYLSIDDDEYKEAYAVTELD